MKRRAVRSMMGVLLLVLCLCGQGMGRTRAGSRGPAPAVAMRARRWHGYWRRTLPLWGGVYLGTLMGVLAMAVWLHRDGATAAPAQGAETTGEDALP